MLPRIGMNSLVTCHLHTIWSDGAADMEAMVEAARRAGLAEIGFSDHFCLVPCHETNAAEWSMPCNGRRLESYVAAVRETAQQAEGIIVRLGIEADFFPETVDALRRTLAGIPWDYVIGAVHFVDNFPLDYSPDPWRKLSQSGIDDLYQAYYERIRDLARSGYCDIVAHFDLPKKFGFYPTRSMDRFIEEALTAIADAGLTLELNTAGWDKPCREPYPAPHIIERANQLGIPVIISADAHRPEEVARHYPEAVRLLRAAGYTTMHTFEQRRAVSVPLPPA